MNKPIHPKILPYLVLLTGVAGFFLRLRMLGSGPDAEGLYPAMPGLWLGLWITALVTVIAVLLLARRLHVPGSFAENYPASISNAIGCVLAAIGMGSYALPLLGGSTELLTTLTGVTGVVAAVTMLAAAYARFRGTAPHFLCHGAVCLFLGVLIFHSCKQWSNESQLGVFLYPFLAQICIMLAAYQHMRFDVELGDRKKSVFWSLTGAYFCIASVADRKDMLFYGCVAVWLLTDLCSLQILKKPHAPQPDDTPETP